MRTLKENYETQQIKKSVVLMDKKSPSATLVNERAQQHYIRANTLIESINEAKLDPQEAKKIADAVKRLETIVDKLGGEQGQLPNISRLIGGIVDELNKFTGAGWWTKMLASMRDSNNPLTKAAALEGLLKGGMEYVETLLDQQGKKLTDDPIADQANVGENIKNAMAKAFDPGRISALSSMGGGILSQLFGTKESLGSMFANDLSNLKPSQLRAFAQQIKSLGTPPPVSETLPAAVEKSSMNSGTDPGTPTQQSSGTKSGTQTTAATQSQTTNTDQPGAGDQEGAIPVPDDRESRFDAQNIKKKAGLQLANMTSALQKKNDRSALYWAAQAFEKLGVSSKDAIEALSPTNNQNVPETKVG